jgi:LAGLIDADG endonuclease
MKLKKFFGCGFIEKNKNKQKVTLRVSSLLDLKNIIIPHFEKYGLITQKAADFKLFKKNC